jgi:hypothetical protein
MSHKVKSLFMRRGGSRHASPAALGLLAALAGCGEGTSVGGIVDPKAGSPDGGSSAEPGAGGDEATPPVREAGPGEPDDAPLAPPTSAGDAGEIGEAGADGTATDRPSGTGGPPRTDASAPQGRAAPGAGASDARATLPGEAGGLAGDADAGGCSGGWTGLSSSDARSPTPSNGFGSIQIKIPTAAQIVGLRTVLTVPAKPPPSGTLFLWPGLQPLPGSANFNPIGNGVLQPVLTWGTTCAPNAPETHASWWISAQYVNTFAKFMGHTGCNGGPGMTVAVGDTLDVAMTLAGTVWTQVVVDQQTGQRVTYDIDMLGQAQDWAIFSIEGPSQKPVSDVVFTSTILTLSSPQTSSCQPSVRGTNDYFATPMTSRDGRQCCISRMILRAQGVAATAPDGP